MAQGERSSLEQQLSQLLESVARADSPAEVCQLAIDALCATVGVERASVRLFSNDHSLSFVAWKGLSKEYRRSIQGHLPWPSDEENAMPVVVPDVHEASSTRDVRDFLEKEGIRGLAFIPLRFREKLLGKFGLYYSAPHEFSELELSIARIIAGHVAFALIYAEQLRAEQRARAAMAAEILRRQRLEAHQDMLLGASALAQSLDVDEILERLSALSVPGFADTCTIHLLDEWSDVLLAHIAHVDPGKVPLVRDAMSQWPAHSDSETGVAVALRTGESTLIEVVTPELLSATVRDTAQLELLKRLAPHSIMIVPLRIPDQTVGSMTFVSTESKRRYGEQDLAIAEALAARAALALHNARLYEEARVARAEAEAAAARVELLAKASAELATRLEPDAALALLADFSVPTLADYCIAYRLEEDGSVRRVGLAHRDEGRRATLEELENTGAPHLDDHHGVGEVLRTGEPLHAARVDDAQLEGFAHNERHLALLRQLAPASLIIAPLRARGHTLGALALATVGPTGRLYTEADLALGLDLANRAALLIDNARLYSLARVATRSRDEMLAIVSHDLRGPLNTIVTAGEVLALDSPPHDTKRAHTSIQRAASQMRGLLDDLLEVARIEGGGLSLDCERVTASNLVAEVVATHALVAENSSISLITDVTEDVELEVDRAKLGQALSNLVGNALKFASAGGEVRVEVRPGDGTVRFSVVDDGPGISAEALPHLFDRFWRAQRSKKGGVGLGLAIAKGIAEAHGGDIEVENRPDKGACFSIVLPRSG